MRLSTCLVFYCCTGLFLLLATCQGNTEIVESDVGEKEIKSSLRYVNPYRNYVVQSKVGAGVGIRANFSLINTIGHCNKCCHGSSHAGSTSEDDFTGKESCHTRKCCLELSFPLLQHRRPCCMEGETCSESCDRDSRPSYKYKSPVFVCKKCNFSVEQAVYELQRVPDFGEKETLGECLKCKEGGTYQCPNCFDSDITASGRITNETRIESEIDELEITEKNATSLSNGSDKADSDLNKENGTELFRFWVSVIRFNKISNNDLAVKLNF